MNRRTLLMSGLAALIVCLFEFPVGAADTPAAEPEGHATIYFSSAPWDGAAYAIGIPLKASDDAAQPNIRISIWGFPEFPESKTIRFSGKEDSGGGPARGDGIAYFQAILNKSMPMRLAGSISFKSLKYDTPVSGTYDLATVDGKRTFKGSFVAAWGNKPGGMIR